MIELPTLYSRGADAMLQWRVWTEGDVIVVEHGQVGGKQTQKRDRAAGTNEGRANARDAHAQAEFEAQARWTKKTKQGYQESLESARTALVLLPMLAHPLVKKTRKKGIPVEQVRTVAYPCHVQRKLNGLRCLAIVGPDRTITMKSRQGTVWETLGHIEEALKLIAQPGDIFDGEIYLHGTPLQTLNGWIKNESDAAAAALRLALQYHIYDMPSVDAEWERRHAELQFRMLGAPASPLTSQLVAVETIVANTEAEVRDKMAQFVAEGYEGAILRQFGYKYEFDKRSEAIIKYKQFTDAEFEITDALHREYFEPGTTVSYKILDKFVCRNNLNAKTFEVVPLGTILEKKNMWIKVDDYIGKRLIVRFLERSVDGIPQGNPVGMAVRLDEDAAEEEAEDWA